MEQTILRVFNGLSALGTNGFDNGVERNYKDDMLLKIKDIIVVAGVLVAIMWLLLLNYGVARTIDEVLQVVQWHRFCVRCPVVLAVLIAALWLVRNGKIGEAAGWSVIGISTVEAVLSAMQLYGFAWSHHSLYKQTGSFYNPGPLGGFLAIGFVVALSTALKEKRLSFDDDEIYCFNIKRLEISLCHQHLYYVTVVVLVLIAMILPSTMSRTAWAAMALGALYVAACQINWRKYLPQKRWQKMALAIGLPIVLAVAAAGAWHLKTGSAVGRVFMWTISARAVADSPWTGHANFKHAYAEAQERYFRECGTNADGGIMAAERYVDAAGCPDYAFNEYLNAAVEWGLPALLGILAFIVLTMVVGHRSRRYGLVGGIITLLVFAWASYPMHLPAFVATLLVMAVGCWWNWIEQNIKTKTVATIALLMVGVVCCLNIGKMQNREQGLRKWAKVQHFYSIKAYDVACREDSALYDRMRWNGRFMYEYGHALHNLKRYAQSNEILLEADQLLNDAMTLNVIGKNYQMQGQYEMAEQYFTKSAYRVPNRLYPHYLMFKMYSDSVSYNAEKAERAANIILSKPVKIESEATRQMFEEAKEYIERQ